MKPLSSAGARRVYVIEEPVAAALGANLPISEPRGSMIVDIGGGTTDIAVLSLGGVIYSHSLRTAGHAMDEAIIDYIRTRHRLLIGRASAETIKKEAGTAIHKVNGTHVAVHIKGRDLQRGFPTEIKLADARHRGSLEPAAAADHRRHPACARRYSARACRRYLRVWRLSHRRRRAARSSGCAALQ